MGVLEVEFKDLTLDFDLRADAKFYSFAILNKCDFVATKKYPLVKLKDLVDPEYIVFKYANGNIYNGLPTSSEYFDDDGEILKYQLVTKEEHPGRIKYEARKGQILISSLKGAKAPVIFIREKYEGVAVSNGFYIFRVKENNNVLWKYVYYVLKSSLMRNILDEHLSRGIGISAYKEIDLLRIKIPLPPRELQEEIVKKIEKIEEQIRNEKQKLIPLQDVIEEVFIKYGVKSTKFERKEFEAFTTDALKIADQKFLRCGAQYRAFWDVHNGLLFGDKSKFPIVKLGSVMKSHKTKTLKKGVLNKEYVLIELEDMEAATGKITNLGRVVTEIGSDKTYFNGCDLITTKLRPYLGYTILNDPELELIGTTELLPFKVNKDLASPEYLKYLLLSYEYLENSNFLMHGKEHPRIHPLDLLNIRIPLPSDLETQQRIVREIQEQEKINEAAQSKIKAHREEINRIILTTLTEDKKIEVT